MLGNCFGVVRLINSQVKIINTFFFSPFINFFFPLTKSTVLWIPEADGLWVIQLMVEFFVSVCVAFLCDWKAHTALLLLGMCVSLLCFDFSSL